MKDDLGVRLVIEALGDSYYPDLGQSVNAERMVSVINSNPLIAAAPELLEIAKAYRNLLRTAAHNDGSVATFHHILDVINKIEGNKS